MSRPSIFITGAAAGIGAATARRFAANGWFVGLADIDLAGVNALAKELGVEQSMAFELNVTDSEQWIQTLEAFFKKTGRLDVLLNNAGILASGAYGDIDLKRQHLMVDINIKGVMNGCYHALPWLKQTKDSRVINMSSASAMYGQPSLAIYSTTKFAIRGFTEALSLEWEEFGIQVMDIMPLFVQTSMVKDMDAQAIENLGVKLTADDVSKTIWKSATYQGLTNRVHWTVGLNTRFFYSISGLMPDWANRQINGYIAKKH